MLKNRHVLTVPSGTAKLLEQNYTYYPKSVKVDNYSGHWMRIDPDGLFVPPFHAGVWIDLFVQSQQITVWAARPPGIGMVSTTFELTGTAIVSVYDGATYPFPGTNVNQPVLQRVPGVAQGSGDILPALPPDYQVGSIGWSWPLFWAAADNNESNEHLQARQVIYLLSAEQACAAGVQTSIAGIVPAADGQRIMHGLVGTDTTGELLIDYSAAAQPVFRSYIQAGIPVPFHFYGNGFNLAGSGASRFRATHSIGGAVYLTVGMART